MPEKCQNEPNHPFSHRYVAPLSGVVGLSTLELVPPSDLAVLVAGNAGPEKHTENEGPTIGLQELSPLLQIDQGDLSDRDSNGHSYLLLEVLPSSSLRLFC